MSQILERLFRKQEIQIGSNIKIYKCGKNAIFAKSDKSNPIQGRTKKKTRIYEKTSQKSTSLQLFGFPQQNQYKQSQNSTFQQKKGTKCENRNF